jgi:hypothetical protein
MKITAFKEEAFNTSIIIKTCPFFETTWFFREMDRSLENKTISKVEHKFQVEIIQSMLN